MIVDWVPAHFPKDDWALARFDGTALYEHADPRQGEHPDWGTLVFNFGRHEVRNFLLANALYWLEEFHIDGLRVDAVASMLYLDYSRKEGEWVPNEFGGRENLEAIQFLQEMNTVVYGRCPGVDHRSPRSRRRGPAVSRPVHLGGLGFGHKWNMGWMHDTLEYFSHDPIHRRFHHHELTFGMMYAFTENFVLPLSHDEVVHGKGSLLDKMPGDRWQQFANLRALYAWMWAHPGKQLLFMGGELAQQREWSERAQHRLAPARRLRAPRRADAGARAQPRRRPPSRRCGRGDFTPDGFRVDRRQRRRPERATRSCASTRTATAARRVRRQPHARCPGTATGSASRARADGASSSTPTPHEFGGSGVGNAELWTDEVAWHGHPQSLAMTPAAPRHRVPRPRLSNPPGDGFRGRPRCRPADR